MTPGFPAHVAVTGAAGGIGSALALDLAHRGAMVACLDLDHAGADRIVHEVGAAGGRAYAGVLDVADRAALEAFVTDAERNHGPFDGLVANAGGVRGANVALADLDDAAWDSVLAGNLSGVFRCVQVLGGAMAARGVGSVVVITSNAAFVAIPGLSHYSAAKGGATALVRSAAVELAPAGVRVNAVAPGPIRTPANARRLDNPAQFAALTARVPMGRPGRPEEVTGAVAYLLGPDASYTTGTTIHVDGGFTCL